MSGRADVRWLESSNDGFSSSAFPPTVSDQLACCVVTYHGPIAIASFTWPQQGSSVFSAVWNQG